MRLAAVAASGDSQDQTCLVEENNREAAIFDATLQRFNFIEYAIVRGGKSEENIHLDFRLFGVLETSVGEGASDDFLYAGYELCLFVAR